MSKKWMDTGYLKAKPQEVNREAGFISGIKVCSAGEAKGHGVHLDSEFIDTLVKQGNERNLGLKARFGHPNMCSTALGTFIGRFTNFSKGPTVREDGTTAACCFADLALSDSAKETPNGNLHDYILSLAENEADMFGTSIVFTPGRAYKRNKKTGEKAYRHVRERFREIEVWYTREDGTRLSQDEESELTEETFVECEKLHACDCVDEPAANDGLFSAFANETIAGQITEFLDLNPQIFEIIENNPEVMEAIAQYGDKFDEFLERYRVYRANASDKPNKEAEMSDEKKDKVLKAKEEPTGVQPRAEEPEAEKMKKAEAEPKAADVDAAVQQALKEDRVRQSKIRELGKRFGFEEDAEKFAADDKSVEEFRAHILDKSPDDWKASLKIKNPVVQETETELAESAGSEAVETIKARRAKKYSAA